MKPGSLLDPYIYFEVKLKSTKIHNRVWCLTLIRAHYVYKSLNNLENNWKIIWVQGRRCEIGKIIHLPLDTCVVLMIMTSWSQCCIITNILISVFWDIWWDLFGLTLIMSCSCWHLSWNCQGKYTLMQSSVSIPA